MRIALGCLMSLTMLAGGCAMQAWQWPQPAPATPAPPGAVAPEPVKPAGGPGTYRMIATGRTHPREPNWYQIEVVLIDEAGVTVMPEGDFSLRLGISDGSSSDPVAIGGMLWEAFESEKVAIPKAYREHYEDRGTNPQGAWRMVATLLKIPMDQVAERLPEGAVDAYARVEFQHWKTPQRNPLPAIVRMDLPKSKLGRRPEQSPARAMTVERVAPAAGGAAHELRVSLTDVQGRSTLPAGKFVISAAAKAGGETSAPEGPLDYKPVEPAGPSVVLASKRGEPAKFAYCHRLLLLPDELASVLKGTASVWVRIEFLPEDPSARAVEPRTVELALK